MNDLEKLLREVTSLSYSIGSILSTSTYNDYDDLSGLNIDFDDVEQLFLFEQLKWIMERLDKVKRDIDYLSSPIKYISTLKKNTGGRYETKHREYTCGSGIEVLLYDDWREKECWVKTSVEHNGDDYYLVGYKNIPLQGLKTRVRGV